MSLTDASGIADGVQASSAYARPDHSEVSVHGRVLVELFGPDGQLKQSVEAENLVTQVGDQVYGERGSGVATPEAPTGMRLGQGGSTAAAKTGAGAAIVTYVTGSQKAHDATFPQSSLSGSSRRITYETTWGAGVATANGIDEAVVTNENPLTNVAGTAANTMSRVVLSPSVNKGASDTLKITWTHDLLGA